VQFVTSWVNSDFRNTSCIVFGLLYCNAVTPITDFVCALFGPHAAMFVNRIYPGKSEFCESWQTLEFGLI